VSRAILIGSNYQKYGAGVRQAGLVASGLLVASRSVLDAAAILRSELKSGDVLLIKGRHDQRLERIALSLAGAPVRCNIKRCAVRSKPCTSCAMLESGWDGKEILT